MISPQRASLAASFTATRHDDPAPLNAQADRTVEQVHDRSVTQLSERPTGGRSQA
jgi:hypothetical protein